jgi:hypothetical protein
MCLEFMHQGHPEIAPKKKGDLKKDIHFANNFLDAQIFALLTKSNYDSSLLHIS